MGVFYFLKRIKGYVYTDRVGILSLGVVLIIMAVLPKFVPAVYTASDPLNLESQAVIKANLYLDSLTLESKQSTFKPYRFNPNYISDYNAYVWGVSPLELKRLRDYRNGNNWVNSALEFKQVTGISDSLMRAMEPYFKFPQWVGQSNQKSATRTNYPKQKHALNTASEEDLQAVRGIGPVLAARIVNFRTRYGGFADTLQLGLIYGLSGQVRRELFRHFAIKNPVLLEKMNLNSASASDLATIPGISFDLATEIVMFRRLHEGIFNLDDLLKIDGMTSQKVAGIKLYLQHE